MPRVVSHTEVAAVADGGTLTIEADTIVTPLAAEAARARGITIARQNGAGVAPTLVRQVARQVVARMGDAQPEVLEAVVAEVMSAIGTGEAASSLVEIAPGIDFCQACLDQERARTRHRAVLTTTGRNQKGIVARVTARIADLGGDILDISQTLVGDYFTMIVVVDVATLAVAFAEFKSAMEAEVQSMGLQAMMMHEDVVNSLHRV
ncbi:MAG TPA: ACT domain-containing protein [Polyangia bacterium]|nr:ACT domain-containing protein [Polyangia bacterium]